MVSWWSSAWTDSVKGIAGGAAGRMRRGRTLARRQPNAELRVQPGGVEAEIIDDSGDRYEVFVGVRAFRDDEWEAVFAAIAAKAGHAAALLDGELEPGVVDDAHAVEVDLLPRPRDLRTACTCPDDAEPCSHAAAVCTLIGDALGDDPFLLLHLRGRRPEEVLEGVREARGSASAPGEGQDSSEPGVPAEELWSRSRESLPTMLPIRDRPGRPAGWPSDPPAHAPFDRRGLRDLVSDAADRAWALLAGGSETGLDLNERTDLARRTAGASPSSMQDIAARADLPPVEFEQLAIAWEMAGRLGVRAVDEPRWTPTPLEMAWARDQLIDAGMDSRRVHISGNRVTAEGRLQFRLSRDGNWYGFTKDTGRWTLAAPPEPSIEDLLDLLLV